MLTCITRSSNHIDELLAMGPKVCGNLTDFIFFFGDTSYGAYNGANDMTDEAVVRLAKSCPKLKKIQLQCVPGLTDGALLAFFQHCPNVTSLEISGSSGGGGLDFSGAALDALREQPGWVPSLKKLILPRKSYGETNFTKSMRALSKRREALTVQLVSVSESKKWGDWELERISETYKKGRKQSKW